MTKNRSWHEEERDPTISNLLDHLKQMRETVPVNYQLKAELKKKLMAQMMALKNVETSNSVGTETQKKRRWFRPSLFLLAIVIVWAVSMGIGGKVSIRTMKSFTAPELRSAVVAQLAPNQDRIALIANHELIVLDEKQQSNFRMSLPAQQGVYTSLAWSPRGDEWAWMKTTPQRTQIWVSQMNGGGSRLLEEFPTETTDGMAWSSDGQWLYASVDQKVWKISTTSPETLEFTVGSDPSPTPSGQKLAVVDQGVIKIVNEQGNTMAEIGEGSSPQWIGDQHIIFLDSEGRISMTSLDSTHHRVLLHAPQDVPQSIKDLHVSEDGDRLLVEYKTSEGKEWKLGEVRR
ncbi:WD40 repeat domain-containing protein [Ammoniphilus sp. CFH 90114]|uniref:TolB family protein n=1 Tax=Ammoniphilus sp. CFH 90114 TaxID=2493665 RepID=UPI00100DBCDC|nr:WD40 repeat domain-containing protein [Ammoniphilus sp. CFH 90114]RXT13524.1 hypothetical protein EIZ39_05060 [Ammoniphilus sp. CFH 90114]